MLDVIDLSIAAPARIETIWDTAVGLGLNPRETRMHNRFFGYEEFRCDPEQPLDTLLRLAEADIIARNGLRAADISLMTYCHTLMSSGPMTSRAQDSILDTYHKGGSISLSLTMNHCASAVSALALHQAVLPPGGLGLIVVGDKAFHPTVRHIVNTTIMGEAAVAILVGRRPGRFRLLYGTTRHDGRFSLNSGRPDDDYLRGFDKFYLEFAVTSITTALGMFGVDLAEIRWLFPHNANAASWRQIGQMLGARPDQIFMPSGARFGHCFAADPFLNLGAADDDGLLSCGDKILLVSIGLGATASCALLEVNTPYS